jgi:hypothetical protein
MMMAVPPAEWSFLQGCSVAQLAEVLRDLAAKVPIERMLRCRRGPKKPRKKKSSGRRIHHVATKKLLDAARGLPPPAKARSKRCKAKG